MTKNEMISAVSARLDDVTKKTVEEVIGAFADVVVDTLTDNRDEKITIPNVGSFSVKHVPERTGIVQMGATKGETWVKPAHDEIQFKVSKAVKELA